MISLWKIVKEASRELQIRVPSIIPPSTSCTNKRVYENRWVFFSLQICPDVTSASLAVISSCLASWADLHVWSLFGWRQPRKTLACTTAVWLIQWMALSLLSQHWVTGGARCYGTWYFQRSRVSTKIQTKIQLRAKHSSCQPGQSAQQLSACKKSESQRVFYFLPDRKTRWFHPIMKNKTFTSSSGGALSSQGIRLLTASAHRELGLWSYSSHPHLPDQEEPYTGLLLHRSSSSLPAKRSWKHCMRGPN